MNVLTTTQPVGTRASLVSQSVGNPLDVAVELASAGGSGVLAFATNGTLGDVPPDTAQQLVLPVALLADVTGLSIVFLTGIANILPIIDADQDVVDNGSLLVELTIDGGLTYTPQAPAPIAWSARGSTGGVGTATINVPINAMSAGVPITGDVEVRLTLTNDGASNADVQLSAAVQALFSAP